MDTGIIITLVGVLIVAVGLYFALKWHIEKYIATQLEAQDEKRQTELDPIKKQVDNHIPSKIQEIKNELKADAKETKNELKADAKETKSELKADIRESEQRQRADAKETKSELKANIRESEKRIIDRITELLNAHSSK